MQIKNNKKYIFVPMSDWTKDIQPIGHSKKSDEQTTALNTVGKLITCDYSFIDHGKITNETYEDYLKTLPKHDLKKDQWIYNIIDGLAEQEKILYRDQYIVIVTNYIWNGVDLDALHILTIPTDKTLRCLRSLDLSHINLLNHCKNKTCEIIKERYNVEKDQLKMYFHYPPSVYHLHIHFSTIYNNNAQSSVEYSHDLSTVIFNLGIANNYYKTAILNKKTINGNIF